MSDALPLPPRPNLEQYRRLARDFQQACRSNDPEAVLTWAARWIERITRLQGLAVTPDVQKRIDADAARMAHQWESFRRKKGGAGPCTLTQAQFFIARAHGFASWPVFSTHVKAMRTAESAVSRFEAAVDAIVNGEFSELKRLLKHNPELVRARSTRDHRSTLLHYVSANGVEDFRQKTPPNITEIAEVLLNAGADVNAESDAYGGRSTPLGLTATSFHPEHAGVQIPLMQLLIEHGAIIDSPGTGSTVNSCLHNGRGLAAEFLAGRGARLDLEGAAGTGRIDTVKTFFDGNGNLTAGATEQQLKDGFAWACEFGQTAVVDFLLQRGMDFAAQLRHHGQTGLHWAAYGGHVDTVKLLLERGAPVAARDEQFGGTPLDWALYAWGGHGGQEGHYEVVALLVRAGLKLEPAWYQDDEDRRRAFEKARADQRMQAALRAGSLGA